MISIEQIVLITKFWVILIFSALVSWSDLKSQNINLDVEGHAIIRGSMDLAHQDDSTSMFIGLKAGITQIIASQPFRNTYVGFESGMGNTGQFNTFFGSQAGQNNQGSHNTLFGAKSGLSVSGNLNTFFGYRSGQHVAGDSNSIAGYQAGMNLINGSRNAVLGAQSGMMMQTGSLNTFIGFAAGAIGSSGHRNTYIGYQADQLNAGTLDQAIAIGYNAKVDCSNCAAIGGSGTDAVNIGLGVTNPATSVHIRNGHARVDSGLLSSWGAIILHPDVDQSGDDIIWFANRTGAERARFHQNGFLGILNNAPNDAVDVSGDVDATGCFQLDDGTLIGGTCSSDIRLKDNIVLLESQLSKILALRPVCYQWKNMGLKPVEHIGFIAQEVEQVIEEMVAADEGGIKRIIYDNTLQLRILKAIQEQQVLIQKQEAEIDALKKKWNKLKGTIYKPLYQSIDTSNE